MGGGAKGKVEFKGYPVDIPPEGRFGPMRPAEGLRGKPGFPATKQSNWEHGMLVWKDSYSVGDSRMDAQHKGLIALINLLDDKSRIDEALRKLEIYVTEHFRHEEELMERAGFPDLEKHKEQHHAFVAWFETQRRAYEAGKASDTAHLDIQGYLKIWLVNHILFSDKAYAKHLVAA